MHVAEARESPDLNAKINLVRRLEQGRWVFEDLAPLARQALTLNGGMAESVPLFALAGRRYRILDGKCDWTRFAVNRLASSDSLPKGALEKIGQLPGGGSPNFSPSDAEHSQWKTVLDHIRFNHRVLSAEALPYLETAVLMQDVPYNSASHPQVMGVVFLSQSRLMGPVEACTLSVAHELGHLELFLLNLVDRLVNQPFDHSMIHAPYQGRKRPPIGRLHSAHALYRMLGVIHPQQALASRYRDLLWRTCDSFTSDELTPFASSVIDGVYRKASKT